MNLALTISLGLVIVVIAIATVSELRLWRRRRRLAGRSRGAVDPSSFRAQVLLVLRDVADRETAVPSPGTPTEDMLLFEDIGIEVDAWVREDLVFECCRAMSREPNDDAAGRQLVALKTVRQWIGWLEANTHAIRRSDAHLAHARSVTLRRERGNTPSP